MKQLIEKLQKEFGSKINLNVDFDRLTITILIDGTSDVLDGNDFRDYLENNSIRYKFHGFTPEKEFKFVLFPLFKLNVSPGDWQADLENIIPSVVSEYHHGPLPKTETLQICNVHRTEDPETAKNNAVLMANSKDLFQRLQMMVQLIEDRNVVGMLAQTPGEMDDLMEFVSSTKYMLMKSSNEVAQR